ncbi:MAG: hypothetical protein OES24_21735 [Acidimicrobiia bacterium]|nr:hypothetical protein [Acidimicrobiia bacterium]
MSANFSDDNPELEALAAELRQRIARELRWEAEDVESETLKQVLRERTLSDVARESMARGDVIAASTPTLTVVGTISHARGDLAIVATGHALVSVNLAGPVTLRCVETASSGGTSSSGGSGSFKARLAEFEMTGELVGLVVATLPDMLVGRITVTAADHIVVRGAGSTEWFVRFADIAMVLQALSRR